MLAWESTNLQAFIKESTQMTRAAAKKPTKNRTETRELRRQQLINATIDSISKRGFSGTTLSTVTKGAKLSHGIVNFHFESKESLYVETLGFLAKEHYDCWHKAMIEAGSAPEHQLSAIIEADFDRTICSPKKLAVWFAFWGQAKYRPNYLKVHHKYDDERYVEIYRLCNEIATAGCYVHIDSSAVTRSLEALVDGLWLNLLLYPSGCSRGEARNDCIAYLASVFPKYFTLPANAAD